jgi:hypothetical protein
VVTLHSRRERIEQLADLLDGTRTEDEVRSDVRRLATLASTVHDEVELPVLDAEARDRIRTTVMAGVYTDLQEAEPLAPPRLGRARPARVVATGVASVLIGTGGVAVAAQEALPGDALYGIKQATESVRLAAAGDHTEQGRLQLALARERLEEVTARRHPRRRPRPGPDRHPRPHGRALAQRRRDPRAGRRTGRRGRAARGGRHLHRAPGPRHRRRLRRAADPGPASRRGLARDPARHPRPAARARLRRRRRRRRARRHRGALRSAPLPPAPPTTTEIESEVSESSSTSRSGPGPPPSPTTSPDAPGPSLPLPAPGTGDGSGDRTVVPRLPGALDDVGQTVDDTVGGVVDGTGRLLEDTLDTVDDTLDDVGGTVVGRRGRGGRWDRRWGLRSSTASSAAPGRRLTDSVTGEVGHPSLGRRARGTCAFGGTVRATRPLAAPCAAARPLSMVTQRVPVAAPRRWADRTPLAAATPVALRPEAPGDEPNPTVAHRHRRRGCRHPAHRDRGYRGRPAP